MLFSQQLTCFCRQTWTGKQPLISVAERTTYISVTFSIYNKVFPKNNNFSIFKKKIMPIHKTTINQRLKDLEDSKSTGKKGEYIELLGINPSKYYRMLEDGVEVSTKDIEQICDRLNLSEEERIYLFTGIKTDVDSIKARAIIEIKEQEVEVIKEQSKVIGHLLKYIPPPPNTLENKAATEDGQEQTEPQKEHTREHEGGGVVRPVLEKNSGPP